MESKKILRKKILDKRKNFVMNLDSNNIITEYTQNLISSVESENKNIVGLYIPMYGEVDLMKLVPRIDNIIAMPRIDGTNMEFVKYETGMEIEKSGFGELMQPAFGEVVYPNIIIMTGLAFSIGGRRLGFGIGHYDRYIADAEKNHKIIKIGVCFDDNLYEYLPYETHDIKLDHIITEKTIITL